MSILPSISTKNISMLAILPKMTHMLKGESGALRFKGTSWRSLWSKES